MKKEMVVLDDKIVEVDLSDLIKNETLYFNATEIAKHFKKIPKDYLENQTTKELIDYLSKKGNSPIKNLVTVKQGRYGGTWMHQKLAIDFARWCSPKFSVELDEWVINKLQEEKQRKQERYIARLEYPELTDALKEMLEDKGKEAKFYHYSNEADMINRIVLGMSAKQFCDENKVPREALREFLSNQEIELIRKLQNTDVTLIKIGYDFDKRKEELSRQYKREVRKVFLSLEN